MCQMCEGDDKEKRDRDKDKETITNFKLYDILFLGDNFLRC